jgi:hypothetical protein
MQHPAADAFENRIVRLTAFASGVGIPDAPSSTLANELSGGDNERCTTLADAIVMIHERLCAMEAPLLKAAATYCRFGSARELAMFAARALETRRSGGLLSCTGDGGYHMKFVIVHRPGQGMQVGADWADSRWAFQPLCWFLCLSSRRVRVTYTRRTRHLAGLVTVSAEHLVNMLERLFLSHTDNYSLKISSTACVRRGVDGAPVLLTGRQAR